MRHGILSAEPLERAARIELAAVRHNVAALRRRLMRPDGTRALLTGVVKADAYGHGAVPVALALADAGVDRFGVAHAAEALDLRDAGIRLPILAWLHTADTDFAEAVRQDVTLGVSGWDLESVAHAVRALRARRSTPGQVRARVHLKADTGLGRHGCTPEDWPGLLARAAAFEAEGLIEVEGVFSHLGVADDPARPQETTAQLHLFQELAAAAAAALGHPLLRHLANTPATLSRPDTHLDMVRVGLGLYGLSPFPGVTAAELGLRPVMSLVTTLANVKRVGAGHGVSYGFLHRTAADTVLGLVPLGYADGVPRVAEGARVHVNGRTVPVVGRIAMDQFVVDLGPNAQDGPGDVVELFGAASGIPADEWAAAAGTISYELVTRIGARVAREHRILDADDDAAPGRPASTGGADA